MKENVCYFYFQGWWGLFGTPRKRLGSSSRPEGKLIDITLQQWQSFIRHKVLLGQLFACSFSNLNPWSISKRLTLSHARRGLDIAREDPYMRQISCSQLSHDYHPGQQYQRRYTIFTHHSQVLWRNFFIPSSANTFESLYHSSGRNVQRDKLFHDLRLWRFIERRCEPTTLVEKACLKLDGNLPIIGFGIVVGPLIVLIGSIS